MGEHGEIPGQIETNNDTAGPRDHQTTAETNDNTASPRDHQTTADTNNDPAGLRDHRTTVETNNHAEIPGDHRITIQTITTNVDEHEDSNGYLTGNPSVTYTGVIEVDDWIRDSGEQKTTHLADKSITSNGVTNNDSNNNNGRNEQANIRSKYSSGETEAATADQVDSCCDGLIRVGGLAYMNTGSGLLKLLQTFIGVVVIGCGAGATMTNASGSSLFFLIFVAVLSSLNALFSLLYFEYYGAPEKRGLEMGETLSNALSSILNFIASFVFLLTVAIDQDIPADGIIITTLVFAWILTFLYCINFLVCLKNHKRKNQRISTPVKIPEEYDHVKF